MTVASISTAAKARMVEIRARETDPRTMAFAEAAGAAIRSRINGVAQSELAMRAKRAPTARAKVIILRRLADNLGTAAAPSVACKVGCTHCCKMPTLVSALEAKEIARATGAKLSAPTLSPVADMSYDGVPCTFLVDNACSIYEHRPFACRVHFAVDRDNTLCEIFPGVQIIAPHYNAGSYHVAYGVALGEHEMHRLADVRAFFPAGLGATSTKGKAPSNDLR